MDINTSKKQRIRLSVSTGAFLSLKITETLSYYFPNTEEHMHCILPYFLHY